MAVSSRPIALGSCRSPSMMATRSPEASSESGGDGGLMPEVAGEQDALEERVPRTMSRMMAAELSRLPSSMSNTRRVKAQRFSMNAGRGGGPRRANPAVVNGMRWKGWSGRGSWRGTGRWGVGWIVAAKIPGSLPDFWADAEPRRSGSGWTPLARSPIENDRRSEAAMHYDAHQNVIDDLERGS